MSAAQSVDERLSEMCVFRFWKKQFVELVGDQDKAVQYRLPIYLGAAAVGE